MAILVSTVVTRVQRIFPDFVNTTAHAEYANKAHREILTHVPLRITTRDIPFTTASEYALQDTEMRVWSAEVLTSATSGRALTETSVERLNATRRQWRWSPTNNITSQYYVWSNTTGRVIGIIPTPASAAAGGYPLIRIYVSVADVLTTSSTIVAGLLDDDLYAYGMAARFAEDEHRDQEAYWKEKFYAALDAEREKYFGMNVGDHPAILPAWMPQGGVV